MLFVVQALPEPGRIIKSKLITLIVVNFTATGIIKHIVEVINKKAPDCDKSGAFSHLIIYVSEVESICILYHDSP